MTRFPQSLFLLLLGGVVRGSARRVAQTALYGHATKISKQLLLLQQLSLNKHFTLNKAMNYNLAKVR